MWNWPNVMTGFGTVFMAIAVIITAIIAGRTLLEGKQNKRQELSTELLSIWQKGKYQKKYSNLRDFYILKADNLKKYYEIEKTTPLDFTPLDEKFMGVLSGLIQVKNFIYKLEFFIERQKLQMENVDLDFNGRLIFNTEKSTQAFYETMIWGYKYVNLPGLITSKDKEILNTFYLKVAEYKKFLNLAEFIKKENEKNIIEAN